MTASAPRTGGTVQSLRTVTWVGFRHQHGSLSRFEPANEYRALKEAVALLQRASAAAQAPRQ